MSLRKRLSVVALLGVSCGSLLYLLRADNPSPEAAKAIADFSLKDTEGRAVALSSFKDKKAVVVIFVGTQCPINNLFLPRLNELAKEYAEKGVQFLGINANRQDSAAAIAEHAKKHRIAFPVLRDEGNAVADRFGAKRTPEAFILSGERKIRYQGRIDDQYEYSVNRPQATRQDLVLALDELLAGKAVSTSTTSVAGCLIGRVTKSSADGQITFAKHVAPIIQKRCQECHRPGQIGPMSLLTYDDASAWAGTIREVVEEKRMPPWHADPRYGKFANDRGLSKEERNTLLAWIDQGTPRGDAKDLPPPRVFESAWKIGKPDMIFTMPNDYDVPAKAPAKGVPYQYIHVETNFAEDKWIERAEAKPDAAEVVHHIIIFVLPPGMKFSAGNPNITTLCGTAPGDMPLILKPGMARYVPKGSQLVFQMHYTPNGRAQKDRSSVGVIFAKEPPKMVVISKPVFNPFFRIPAGADNHKVESSFVMQEEGYLVGFMPHMHLRGKDFLYRAIFPDGKTETLLSVPRYDFNWQSSYRLAELVKMPKGAKIHCIAHFDNSKGNPNNPDPTAAVIWGDQTWEEMMIGWTDIAYERKK